MATAKASKTKWHRPPGAPLIRDFVTFSMPAGCTHADVIQKIADQLGWRVASLPDQLRRNPIPRGRSVFGSAREVLNQIVANYENLHWTVSDGALRFDVREARIDLSAFDELAGRLMDEARRAPNGRILPDEYRRIAAVLDKQGFKPTQWLEGRDRVALKQWNQKHPPDAIHTFSKALERKILRWNERKRVRLISRKIALWRAVLKRLNRSLEKRKKRNIRETIHG
jgi:hypothetical protein